MGWRNTRVESRNVIGPDNLTDFAHIKRAWREGGNGWTRTDRVGYSSGNGWTTDPAGFPGHTPAPGAVVKIRCLVADFQVLVAAVIVPGDTKTSRREVNG